jgi:predicted murein hydrolase (TIGR00659 family)
MPMTDFAEIWVYLSREPLLWLTATLAAYAIGDACFRAANRAPLVNPVLISVVLLATLLWLTGTSYQSYFEGAQFVHFLLGPATVCLAYPLWENLPRVRKALLPVGAALVAGSLTSVVSALAIGYALGVKGEALISLSAKSTTAPVAIGIAEKIGGSPTLTAVLVIMTGIMGAAMATPLLNALGLKDWRARGFALGVAAHGLGTARAMQVNPTAGAFAGLGMGLNAVMTALIAPYVLAYFL